MASIWPAVLHHGDPCHAGLLTRSLKVKHPTEGRGMDAAIAKAKPSLTHLIVATSVGNALEWYDIVIYGYFALAISKVFFPSGDPTTGLMLALGTFVSGVQARVWQICAIGGVLFLAVPGLGWLDQSPLLLTAAACVIVVLGGVAWWVIHRGRSSGN